jgi:hypothetical protein
MTVEDWRELAARQFLDAADRPQLGWGMMRM